MLSIFLCGGQSHLLPRVRRAASPTVARPAPRRALSSRGAGRLLQVVASSVWVCYWGCLLEVEEGFLLKK